MSQFKYRNAVDDDLVFHISNWYSSEIRVSLLWSLFFLLWNMEKKKKTFINAVRIVYYFVY